MEAFEELKEAVSGQDDIDPVWAVWLSFIVGLVFIIPGALSAKLRCRH